MTVFANPRKLVAFEILGYNRATIPFAPYRAHWRSVRNIATSELLSNTRLEMFRHLREFEIKESIHELYQLWSKKKDGSGKAMVEMKGWFGDVTLNMILMVIAGKTLPSFDNDPREC
ncbi:hypothetical protein SLE2022_100470 [Rubroshorea leprosula]